MKNYIDANKLKAEIERLRDTALERQKNLEKIGQETVLNEMIVFNLNKILSFIDSLLQEQSEADTEEDDGTCPVCGCALDAAGCCSCCGYGRR